MQLAIRTRDPKATVGLPSTQLTHTGPGRGGCPRTPQSGCGGERSHTRPDWNQSNVSPGRVTCRHAGSAGVVSCCGLSLVEPAHNAEGEERKKQVRKCGWEGGGRGHSKGTNSCAFTIHKRREVDNSGTTYLKQIHITTHSKRSELNLAVCGAPKVLECVPKVIG